MLGSSSGGGVRARARVLETLVLDEAFQSSKSKLMGNESAGQASQVLAFNLGSCFFVDPKLLSLSLKLLPRDTALLVAK